MAARGHVREAFPSIQGEGPWVGVLQAFVRFAGCSQRCVYCDSAASRGRSATCELRGPDGTRRIANPVAPEEIVDFVRPLAGAPGFHSLSATGGEPLEQPAFLVDLAARCRGTGIPVYLETNGLHPRAARDVAGLVDYVSLDLKLPSLCPGASFDVYRETLRAFEGTSLFCKIVVAPGFSDREIEEASRVVEEIERRTTLVIQPATPVGESGAVTPEELLACHAAASRHLEDVRVIPQCHRLLGLP